MVTVSLTNSGFTVRNRAYKMKEKYRFINIDLPNLMFRQLYYVVTAGIATLVSGRNLFL